MRDLSTSGNKVIHIFSDYLMSLNGIHSSTHIWTIVSPELSKTTRNPSTAIYSTFRLSCSRYNLVRYLKASSNLRTLIMLIFRKNYSIAFLEVIWCGQFWRQCFPITGFWIWNFLVRMTVMWSRLTSKNKIGQK